MAKEETDIVHCILINEGQAGRLFKNVRGSFYTKDSVARVLKAFRLRSWDSLREALKSLRIVAAGLLAPGSSDLIGWTWVTITPDMVGRRIAVFTAIEVKTPTGQVQADQRDFVNFVRENGGFAGVARCAEDARKIRQISD